MSFDAAVELAAEALRHRQYARAEEVCEAILDKWPNHPQAMNFQGVAVLSQGRPDEGLAILEKASGYYCDDSRMHSNLGWAYAKLGRVDDAVAAYRKAHRLAPELVEPAWNLANLLARLDEHDEAAKILEGILEQQPRHTISCITLAQVRFRQGDAEAGEALLRQAVEGEEDRDEAHYHLGLFLLASGRTDEATDALKQAVAVNPLHARAEATLGHLLVTAKKNYADATEPLVRAVNLNPDETQAWLDLGRAIGMIGQFDRAIDVYEKLLTRDPDNAEAARQIEMMQRRKKTFARK
jgi:tetratricopeptide (TPR) repeat protein